MAFAAAARACMVVFEEEQDGIKQQVGQYRTLLQRCIGYL
jgi:hypothetical protein